MIEGSNVFRVLKECVKQTNTVAGRVFNMRAVPPDVTYPYVAIQALGDGSPVLSGDGAQRQEWQDSAQVDVYFKSGRDFDPNVLRTIIAALNFPAIIAGDTGRFRVRSMNNIPTPDGDVSVRYSITVTGFRPLEAL